MISLVRISLWRRLRELVSPRHARKREAELHAAIAHLVAHPEEPCMVDGIYVAHGYCGLPNGRWSADTIELGDNRHES